MNRSLTYSADSEPTFQEWLAQRDDITSRELYTMFQATSCYPFSEYRKAMDYLRQKYIQDMGYRKYLLTSNPFMEQEAEHKLTNNQGGAETLTR